MMPSLSPIFSQGGRAGRGADDGTVAGAADAGAAGAGASGAARADPGAAAEAVGAGAGAWGGSSASAGKDTSHPSARTRTVRIGPARQSETCFILVGFRLFDGLSIAGPQREMLAQRAGVGSAARSSDAGRALSIPR